MKATPEITALSAQITHASGLLLNRAQRRAAKRRRPHQTKQFDDLAGLRLLDHSRPYEPGEMVGEHIKTRDAFDRLKNGAGDVDDFDRCSMILNVGLIRAEDIDAQLVQVIHDGQMAFVRMKSRYLRGLGFGFDAQGLRDAPAAMDAYEAMTDASSPQQMKLAIRAAYARISNGQLLGVE